MDIYMRDGIILRHFPRGDGSTLVEIDYLFEQAERAEIYRLAACYKALHTDSGVDYVLNLYDGREITLMEAAFVPAVQNRLAEALLRAREIGSWLYIFFKKKDTYGDRDRLETNKNPFLEKYRGFELTNRAFWEKCSEMLSSPR